MAFSEEEVKSAAGEVRSELAKLDHDSSPYSDPELYAFFYVQKRNATKAAAAVIAAAEWKKEKGSVKMADISSFFRAPPGAKYPPGCYVVLEDGKGDCARDAKGRPILNVIGGNVHGTSEEMTMQAVYALQRASIYAREGDPPGTVCCIMETVPRSRGDTVVFGLPNASHRQMFDAMKRYFPGTELGDTHFCGLNRFVLAGFYLCKPFFSKEVFERLFLKSNFKHLKNDGHIAPDNILPQWDSAGTFEFDLDEYVEWRAKEEGATEDEICPRGLGKQYTQDDSMLNAHDLLGGEEQMKTSKVIKYGSAQKQGNGVGFFSSRRWKSKMLVVIPTCLMYFDSEDKTSENKAKRLIHLDATCTVQVMEEAGSDVNVLLKVYAMGRDFAFGFDSTEEANEWKEAIEKAFHHPDASP